MGDLSETKHGQLYASIVTTYSLAAVTVLLRFVSRRLKRCPLWWDDWLILVALLAATGYFIDCLMWIHYGLGRHYETLGLEYHVLEYRMYLPIWISEIFWTLTITFIKLSILAFYWRVFNVPSIRLPIKIILGVMALWFIAKALIIVLHCVPLVGFWDKTVPAKCGIDVAKSFVATNTIHFVIDVVILALPIPYIRQLVVSPVQKVLVLSMFLLGGLVSVMSIINIIISEKIDSKNKDISWTMTPIAVWASVEINIGVVCANLPSLRPIWLLFTGDLKKGYGSNTNDSRPGGSSYASFKRRSAVISSRMHSSKPFKHADSDSVHGFTVVEEAVSNSDSDIQDRDRDMGTSCSIHARHNPSIPLQTVPSANDRIMVNNEINVEVSGRK